MNNAIRRKGSTEIAGHLRREIIAGNLAAKERLPPERVLANEYGVARGTVRSIYCTPAPKVKRSNS